LAFGILVAQHGSRDAQRTLYLGHRHNNAFVGVPVLVQWSSRSPCGRLHVPLFPLAYLRTEDRRFGILLKEEGRTLIPGLISKVLGRRGGDANRCMKTQDCRLARVDTACSSPPPPVAVARLFVRYIDKGTGDALRFFTTSHSYLPSSAADCIRKIGVSSFYRFPLESGSDEPSIRAYSHKAHSSSKLDPQNTNINSTSSHSASKHIILAQATLSRQHEIPSSTRPAGHCDSL
jgi:hypothetical protein